MPLSVTNQKTFNLGGVRVTRGQFTGQSGDATGTLALQGSILWDGRVWANAAGGFVEAAFSWTVSGTVLTVTIENFAPVTDGYFSFTHS